MKSSLEPNTNAGSGSGATGSLTLPHPSREPIQLGEFGARWQFPSDHVPVAAVVEGISIGTWNVLNSKWIWHFTEKNGGLSGSKIVLADTLAGVGATLTNREEDALSLVRDLMESLDVLLLQECSPQFISELRSRARPGLKVVTGQKGEVDNDILAIFDERKLLLDDSESECKESGYRCKAGKPIMNLLFRQTDGSPLRIIHSHVPGDPQNPGLPELASYVAQANNSECPMVVAGDLNFVGEQVQRALLETGLASPIMMMRLNTCVGTTMEAKDLDHIVVFNPRASCSLVPEEKLPIEVREARRILNQGEL